MSQHQNFNINQNPNYLRCPYCYKLNQRGVLLYVSYLIEDWKIYLKIMIVSFVRPPLEFALSVNIIELEN
jgi:hypothetical protein